VDGKAVRACRLTVKEVGNRAVTTIEGVGATPVGAKVQQAWIEHAVAQCGYCQGGQVLLATALLSGNAHPTDAQIDEAMARNICRCGTYVRIRQAVKSVAQSQSL
jgi:isoquinoline 1-oxidoreductase alpha subunit